MRLKLKFKTLVCTLLISFCTTTACLAQQTSRQGQHELIFSAVNGTISRPDSILAPSPAKTARLTKGDTSAFEIISFTHGKILLAFQPSTTFTGIAIATLQITGSSNKPIENISLTGLSTNGLEGQNEPPLSSIVQALGYHTNIGWTGLANHSRPELMGDEIPYSSFRKAGNGKVEMIPVARYSPDFELPYGYYIIRASVPEKHMVATLAKRDTYPEHQTLFPSIAFGSILFDPGDNSFGFFTTSPTHTAYSDDVWNMLYHPANAVHATRIYPLKDAKGKALVNAYLLCFEEAQNGDYNDYVFIVKNVLPNIKEPYTTILNGKNLDGWQTFLNGKGRNSDPENNFRIEDGALHVIGKDLGYVITDSGYSNYDLRLEFKFGERRWPPRDTAKRDGGLCYNIPMDEPDSIWPKSIEFQIQQGDVGDFWLLAFSTIKVNGVQNKPSIHTRMVKQKDAEKPPGEWNSLELISHNGTCVQIVNGVVVNVGEEASVKSGRILLQSEYAEIYYRNLRIRKL
jgi:hypothetical protein